MRLILPERHLFSCQARLARLERGRLSCSLLRVGILCRCGRTGPTAGELRRQGGWPFTNRFVRVIFNKQTLTASGAIYRGREARRRIGLAKRRIDFDCEGPNVICPRTIIFQAFL